MEQAPRDMVTAPSQPELRKHLDNALRHTVIIGVSCAGSGVGLHDPDEFHLTQHNL